MPFALQVPSRLYIRLHVVLHHVCLKRDNFSEEGHWSDAVLHLVVIWFDYIRLGIEAEFILTLEVIFCGLDQKSTKVK